MASRPSDRQSAVLISVAVGVVVAVITTATFYWIVELSGGEERREAARIAAAPYDPTSGIRLITNAEPNTPTDGRQPWLGTEAWTAGVQVGQEYIAQFPEPQNVEVLTGMSTAQIWGYMQQNVSGALGVGCQYCHDINNFAADTYPQKAAARNMLRLVNDLNAQFIVNLPNWRGNYVQCATCHNGQPINMEVVGDRFVGSTPPIPATVDPLDSQGDVIVDAAAKPEEIQEPLPLQNAVLYYVYNYQVWRPYSPDEPESGRGSLALTYEGGRTQEQVNINQGTMNYMAWSLGGGCTFCHNSRNFIDYELDAAGNLPNPEYGYNKLKAQRMLLMTTWLNANWEQYGAIPKTDVPDIGPAGFYQDQYYRRIEGEYYTVPGCYSCHAGRDIPKAAINQADIPEGDAGLLVFPPVLRGGT
ncbi:MAG: photosynthetic reaction center cytochrome c subunit [Chloroflexales bacterium]|nr:photosynthetic reaction center cytochrome c subunit [Chloroflexales bacterium]